MNKLRSLANLQRLFYFGNVCSPNYHLKHDQFLSIHQQKTVNYLTLLHRQLAELGDLHQPIHKQFLDVSNSMLMPSLLSFGDVA